jgi:hypothetical protein
LNPKHVRHVKLDTKKKGTTTSPIATSTGIDDTKSDATIATMKITVRTHLLAFSAATPQHPLGAGAMTFLVSQKKLVRVSNQLIRRFSILGIKYCTGSPSQDKGMKRRILISRRFTGHSLDDQCHRRVVIQIEMANRKSI